MSRWPFLVRIAAGTLLILVVVHTAAWWWLARQVRDGFQNWADAARASGQSVSSGPSALTGWPFAAGITLPDMALDGPGWHWTAEHLSLTVRPWDPAVLRLEPSGHQTLAAGGVRLGLDARSMLVALLLPAGTDPALDVRDAVLETPLGRAEAAQATGRVATATGHTDITADVSGLSLPPGQPYLLGPTVAGAHITTIVTPPLPMPGRADVLAWHDAGGKAEITGANLRWGSLVVDATGTASLDRSLQPVADVRATISGQDKALDEAVSHGTVQPRAAMAIRAVLGLLGGASPGQPSRIPVSLRDGTVAVAGFPVARFAPIPWP